MSGILKFLFLFFSLWFQFVYSFIKLLYGENRTEDISHMFFSHKVAMIPSCKKNGMAVPVLVYVTILSLHWFQLMQNQAWKDLKELLMATYKTWKIRFAIDVTYALSIFSLSLHLLMTYICIYNRICIWTQIWTAYSLRENQKC